MMGMEGTKERDGTGTATGVGGRIRRDDRSMCRCESRKRGNEPPTRDYNAFGDGSKRSRRVRL